MYAQSRSLLEAKARDELARQGLDENEVRIKLLEKGIDIDAVDISNPNEIARAEKALREVINELKGSASDPLEAIGGVKKDTTKRSNIEDIKEVARESDDVTEAIEDGATLEEAVSEELLDAQETALPPSNIYGQQIFRNKSIKLYRQSEDVKPPESYVLGVGDAIGVSIWGYSEENFVFEINSDGYIKPDDIPRIYLKGISYGQAKRLLESRFSQYYRFKRHEFEVTLNFARTINVNITGEVFNFGSFNLPAINSAFNALVAAGGPSNIGSVRKIQLKRDGEPDKIIDIYKYLLNPDQQENLYIVENDYIHVPIAERLVKIKGAINRPFKYELIGKENLKDLIFFAGGFKADAYKKTIRVKRYKNDQEIIADVDYNAIENGNGDFILLNGDEVEVLKIPDTYENYVNISGTVRLPGEFKITENTKVSDVLKQAGVKKEARTDIAYIKRQNDDNTNSYLKINLDEITSNNNALGNVTLQSKDEIIIFSKSRFINKYDFKIGGAVRNAGSFSIDESQSLQVSDAIILAGGAIPSATDFAYLYRKDPTGGKVISYKKFNIKEILSNPKSAENFILEPNDEIILFDKRRYQDETEVKIDGAVREPGSFEYDPSLTLKDLILLAGGFQIQAQNSRIDVFRVDWSSDKETNTYATTISVDEDYNVINNENFKLQPFDQIVVRTAPKYGLQKGVVIEGQVLYPGGYALISEEERISSIIERSGGLTDEAFPEGATLLRALDSTGYMVIKLDEILLDKNSFYNFILKRGDRISIPKRQDYVTIIGETKANELYPNSLVNTGKLTVAFHPGRDAKYYIDKYAGGLGKRARPRLVTVQHLNGELETSKGFLVKNYPKIRAGSIITVGAVPEKIKPIQSQPKEKIDWGRVLADSVVQATAVLSLILLIQRVN